MIQTNKIREAIKNIEFITQNLDKEVLDDTAKKALVRVLMEKCEAFVKEAKVAV